MTFNFDFTNLLAGLLQDTRTPEQKACTHVLSYRMQDGKYFCASCRYTSPLRLRKLRRGEVE